MSHIWPLTLRDRELLLRPLRRGDKDAYEALRRRNRSWLQPWDATDPGGPARPPSYAAALRFSRGQARLGTQLPLAITVDRDVIGQVTADPIVYGSQRSTVMGYWIDRDHAGRGLVPRALALVMDHCFLELGLHRVEVDVRPQNAASRRVVEKLHMREEGMRRGLVHVDGAFRDHLCYALTEDDLQPVPDLDPAVAGTLRAAPAPDGPVLARYRREFE
jgi:ribosomal-protein-alanine N-acetyltransferase